MQRARVLLAAPAVSGLPWLEVGAAVVADPGGELVQPPVVLGGQRIGAGLGVPLGLPVFPDLIRRG